MPRARAGTPSLARTSASHSTLSAAMSTPAGHSVLQALQATHVPSTSLELVRADSRQRHRAAEHALQSVGPRARARRPRCARPRPAGTWCRWSSCRGPRRSSSRRPGRSRPRRRTRAAASRRRAAVVGAEAQVGGHRRAVDDRAGAQQPARVEGVLDRDHGRVQVLGTEQAGQGPASRTPHAVLARDARRGTRRPGARRPAASFSIAPHAGRGLEVEQRADVHAAGRGVPGERGARALRRHETLEVVDEVGEAFSGATAVSSTKDAGRSAPGAPMSNGSAARRRAPASASAAGSSSHSTRVAPRSPASARSRPSPARASSALPWYSTVSSARSSPAEQRRHACEHGEVRRRAQRLEVEQLDRGGARLEDREVGFQGGAQGGERQRRPRPRRRKTVKRDLELGEQRQGALGPGEQLRQVRRRLENSRRL